MPIGTPKKGVRIPLKTLHDTKIQARLIQEKFSYKYLKFIK